MKRLAQLPITSTTGVWRAPPTGLFCFTSVGSGQTGCDPCRDCFGYGLLHDPDAERGGLQAYSAVEFHALSAQKHGICLARAFDALGEGAD